MLIRQQLETALAAFGSQPLPDAARNFWAALGYSSENTAEIPTDFDGFCDTLGITLRPNRVLAPHWNGAHFLFQITGDELKPSLFERQTDFAEEKSYLFFALELQTSTTRSQLATLARELNSQFAAPILLLVKTGAQVHLAVVDRRPNKRDQTREVLEKVTLIRDISPANPHPGHLRILEDLALPRLRATDWDSLHREWKRVLDLSLLNKRFFAELSDWYFHARSVCTFPQPQNDPKSAEEHASTCLIRLITRAMFAYFLKERGLLPAALFDPQTAPALLKNPGEASYYRAVLQNLFFATLNTEIPARGWKKADSSGGYNAQFLVHNVWRYRDSLHNPEAVEALFQTVPFLNGGLFECLDRAQTDRSDGFSERKDNPLHVPDALFFGPPLSADLNADYGTKGKTTFVTPLLELFAKYKFTVSENTPLEEDVALDPELLGKVFENLLASYNPETRTTARKQSGSFYTPREIVDYMVEESLVAVLSQKTGIEETAVRALFSPETPRLEEGASPANLQSGACALFQTADSQTLINAIESLSILDPACGSGAFPMGALNKLVELLKRLDPENKLWRARLEARADELQDPDATRLERARLREIFEGGDNGDYARKLFLIEKCLFGVDIQPVAVQIAKLRFFIALAIEQTKTADAHRPLKSNAVRVEFHDLSRFLYQPDFLHRLPARNA